MTGKSSYSQKISEFQAEGLGFQNFAWLGSNPSDAPEQYIRMNQQNQFFREKIRFLFS